MISPISQITLNKGQNLQERNRSNISEKESQQQQSYQEQQQQQYKQESSIQNQQTINYNSNSQFQANKNKVRSHVAPQSQINLNNSQGQTQKELSISHITFEQQSGNQLAPQLSYSLHPSNQVNMNNVSQPSQKGIVLFNQNVNANVQQQQFMPVNQIQTIQAQPAIPNKGLFSKVGPTYRIIEQKGQPQYYSEPKQIYQNQGDKIEGVRKEKPAFSYPVRSYARVDNSLNSQTLNFLQNHLRVPVIADKKEHFHSFANSDRGPLSTNIQNYQQQVPQFGYLKEEEFNDLPKVYLSQRFPEEKRNHTLPSNFPANFSSVQGVGTSLPNFASVQVNNPSIISNQRMEPVPQRIQIQNQNRAIPLFRTLPNQQNQNIKINVPLGNHQSIKNIENVVNYPRQILQQQQQQPQQQQQTVPSNNFQICQPVLIQNERRQETPQVQDNYHSHILKEEDFMKERDAERMFKTDSLDFLKKFLQAAVDLERETEDKRKKIISDQDFSLSLFYEFFDKNETGLIKVQNLMNGLHLLGINAEERDIELLIQAYSNRADVLTQEDFVEMISPKTINSENIFVRKPRVTIKSISNQTRTKMANIMKCLLNCECILEGIRQKIEKAGINLNELFSKWKNLSKKSEVETKIDKEILRDLLTHSGVFINKGELTSLMKRFTDKDFFILSDFVEQLSTKN